LNAAVLLPRNHFEGFHLALEAAQLGRVGTVTTHEECGWPEDDKGNAGGC
jgi:hypothetical protein